MELVQLTDRISYLPHQPERERPLLAYIRGDRYCLAIDAGYSSRHVGLFYSALSAAGLREPDFTVLTHWHCDHSYGLHAVSGCTIACALTNAKLREHRLKSSDPSYREYIGRAMGEDNFYQEYGAGVPIIVEPASIEFSDSLTLDLGGVTAEFTRIESAHSADSVLIYIPEQKTLFLGDTVYGDFRTAWAAERQKYENLLDIIEKSDCDYCVCSHMRPGNKPEIIRYLNRRLEQSRQRSAV